MELYGGSFRFFGNQKYVFLDINEVHNETKVLETIDEMFEVYHMYKYILNEILDPAYQNHFIDMNGQIYGIYNGKRIEIVCYGDDTHGEHLVVRSISDNQFARIEYMDSSEASLKTKLMSALREVTSDRARPRPHSAHPVLRR